MNASLTVSNASLERLVPAQLAATDVTGQQTLALHAERYRFAARHALPGRLLDIACGVGYGTRSVVEDRSDITGALGVDISEQALAHARANYAHPKISYAAGDAMSFRSAQPYQTIVSLETIEHLPDPRGFVENLIASMAPIARIIASVPTTPSVDANPHHCHDFTEASFRRLFLEFGLREVAALPQTQSFSPLRIMARQEKRLADLRPNLMRYYMAHPSSALKRAASILRDGFNNRYITIVWERRLA